MPTPNQACADPSGHLYAYTDPQNHRLTIKRIVSASGRDYLSVWADDLAVGGDHANVWLPIISARQLAEALAARNSFHAADHMGDSLAVAWSDGWTTFTITRAPRTEYEDLGTTVRVVVLSARVPGLTAAVIAAFTGSVPTGPFVASTETAPERPDGEEPFVPRTERQHWQDIADALNATARAGMPVSIDIDGTLTDHRMWSVVWDRQAEQWVVGGYEDDCLPDQLIEAHVPDRERTRAVLAGALAAYTGTLAQAIAAHGAAPFDIPEHAPGLNRAVQLLNAHRNVLLADKRPADVSAVLDSLVATITGQLLADSTNEGGSR